MTNQPASTSRIFVSYSHRGNGPKWKAALLEALQVFERHHLLDVWQDGKIRVSSFWDDDITQAMKSARLAVLLLTDEALKSEYIVSRELPVLRDRRNDEQLPVIPVICEPCDWKAHDWIRATQAPNASNPLSELPQDKTHRAFRELATDIAEQISHRTLAELASTERPAFPTITFLDRFPITSTAGLQHQKLIGREQELALLDLVYSQPHTAIVSLVAWGGVGKTMLVQHWLQRLEREGWYGARHVYAWSFYSQGTKEDRQGSEDTFFAHALEWFGVQCEPTLSSWDKGRLLADAVIRERTLLILDGIEPLQYPPGPMGGQLRAPGVQSLLKQLARKANANEHRGLCLVTTREPLTDLADFERRPDAAWGSVLRVDLGNLTDEAGAALLHHAGTKRAGAAEIKLDDKELLAASREVDGHALTLNLLGRFLARAHSGDIRRRDLVRFEEADLNEQGGTTFKMLAAFENWFARSGEFGARQLAVLSVLGLFDRPADVGCIAALRQPPMIAGLSEPLFTTRLDASTGQAIVLRLPEEDWNTAVSFLVDFGLITIEVAIDNSERSLDCHPLIREHFANRLREPNSEAWRLANRRVFEYLARNTTDKRNPGLNDLLPLYDAVAHGCFAGLHQTVWQEILLGRILRGGGDRGYYSVRRLGAFSLELSAASCFFEHQWTRVYPYVNEMTAAWLFRHVGMCLSAVGRHTEAAEPLRESIRRFVELQDWGSSAICARELSEVDLLTGNIAIATGDAGLSIRFADFSAEWHLQRMSWAYFAHAWHQRGEYEHARSSFEKAEQLQTENEPRFPHLYLFEGFWRCDFLLRNNECSAWQQLIARSDCAPFGTSHVADSCNAVSRNVEQAMKWSDAFGDTPVVNAGLDRITLVRARLYAGILRSRYGTFDSTVLNADCDMAIDTLRRSGYQDELPRGLLTRACLHVLQDNGEGAQVDLDEAWDIAERGPMRLHMADIHLHRARLFFREKLYPWESPQADLAAAEKLINDCGYHRRDEELADAKRAILDQAN